MYQPERPLEPRESMPVCTCDWCGGDLYAGDDAYKIDGRIVCRRCIEDVRFEVEEPEPPEYGRGYA